ncbi:CYP6AB4 protein [Danaus plexippus plexippus]|uniref:unspecific monooxygenase n=1 Tax=Danaus plexippus plexippus TaxID=278856 RepID=A0A212FLM2_DANPL|nr:CYP6AB4 protein [Danaus plexippus plexippus]
MTYLESAFKEGMRTFPSLGFLVRQCAKRYTFEDLIITLQALHNDPKYFENPTEFRPERFTRPSPAAMISSCTCRLARVRARVSASGWVIGNLAVGRFNQLIHKTFHDCATDDRYYC